MVAARNSLPNSPNFIVRSNRPGWVTLAVSPSLESRDLIAEAFRPHLTGLPEDLVSNLLLAADELVANAMEHGCNLDPRRCVDVSLIRTERMIMLYVHDDGEGFSVNAAGHAAINNPPDDPLHHTERRNEMGLRPGGFGIMLAKKVADELIYNQHGNSVMVLKYLK